MALRGKAAGFGLMGHWRGGVCSWDERETAGSCAVGLFLFHPWAGGQSLDRGGELMEMRGARVRKERVSKAFYK